MEHRSFPDDFAGRRYASLFSRSPSAARTAELAARDDLQLGDAAVCPSRKSLAGPAATVVLEPRVMQVLLALADAGGKVVTREQLIATCWGGQIVGDDAINRAIAAVRRAAREAGSAITVETVPRIGYRLALDDLGPAAPAAVGAPALPRRALLAAGAAVVAGGAAFAAARLLAPRRDPQVQELLERGRAALRAELPDSTQQGIEFLEHAVRLAPRDAEAWGLLALAQRNVAEYAPPEAIAGAVAAVERCVGRALALDPEQPDALAARAILPPIFGDWLAAERRLAPLHARFPRQVDVIGALGLLTFSVGRTREAARLSDLAVGLEPLSPIFQYRRAYHLWTLGRVAEADRTIDRALQLWPRHPAVWYARFLIFAGSRRPGQALSWIAVPDAAQVVEPLSLHAWQASCRALQQAEAAATDAATAACLAAARATGGGCVNAILALNLLGALDQAFAVAEGYLLRRGPLSPDIGRIDGAAVNEQRWRKTLMLFTPVTAPMRADPRFEPLMRDLGLAEYWRLSGTEPDYRRG